MALLIRRCRLAFGGHDIICIGTSATMTSGGSVEEQKREVAKVAETLFGVSFDASQVIGERLERATPEIDLEDQKVIQALRATIEGKASPPETTRLFGFHPMASSDDFTFRVRTEERNNALVGQAPRRIQGDDSAAEDSHA